MLTKSLPSWYLIFPLFVGVVVLIDVAEVVALATVLVLVRHALDADLLLV